MQRVAIFLLAHMATGSLWGASYQKTNDDIIDPILTRNGDVHVYSGSDLKSSVNIDHAYLKNAFLREADLENANMGHVDLRDADLVDANLSNAYMAYGSFRSASMMGVQLESTNLTQAALSDANLYGAYLVKSFFYGANLINANLSHADLDGVTMARADISGANFMGAENFQDTSLDNSAMGWVDAYFHKGNEPIWAHGMSKDWRDNAGIKEMTPGYVPWRTPEPSAVLLVVIGLAMLPRRPQ